MLYTLQGQIPRLKYGLRPFSIKCPYPLRRQAATVPLPSLSTGFAPLALAEWDCDPCHPASHSEICPFADCSSR